MQKWDVSRKTEHPAIPALRSNRPEIQVTKNICIAY